MEIEEALEQYKIGKMPKPELMRILARKPYEDLGFAKIDTHRCLRRGFPEVIYCKDKTPEQVRKIAQEMAKSAGIVLGTKAKKEHIDAVRDFMQFDEESGLVWIENKPAAKQGKVLVMCAGTSDIPIAEEAAKTAELMGSIVVRKFDVGVAGFHRLSSVMPDIQDARAIIVVAGMEGALPTVVSSLASVPVIAVPTSVGYGASFGGISALLTMLNSCSPGIAVVNIDNGFGAGYLASLINLK
jgi:pyridinium-3,5-biscarboxylic acid mononucleotide synthase